MDTMTSETLANEARMIEYRESYAGEHVQEAWACPFCGETRMDYLLPYEDDSDQVHCDSCGEVYQI